MNKTIVRPEHWKLLYENLFARRDRAATVELLSKGLDACTKNAELLLKDADLLINTKRYARGHFLIATADEEMAKAYLILDGCRLNFNTHETYLRDLCRAFYGHVEKYAYNRVSRSDVRDMPHAKEIFHSDLVRWWPSGGIESGEPDMPHATYFSRESNLYVDYIDFDQDWWIPTDINNSPIFEWFPEYDPYSNSQRALAKLIYTQNLGLFGPDALKALNDTFRNHLITEKTTNEKLFALYNEMAGKIKNLFGLPPAKFNESVLMGWPLYHFLQTGPHKTGKNKT
mgnify:CR=1 FL=1